VARPDPGDASTVEPAVRPGALSALLEELVRAPDRDEAGWEEALRPGDVVGRFELVRELGRGGFGIVYEAVDRELGRRVAFKALRVGQGPRRSEERLLEEAEAAARLSHPNIVTLHDVGRSERGPYLVLELLRGETLAARLERGRPGVREAVRIGVEIARGLAHAHERGVIHRDLTPGNVFLCDDGQVKVLDLGMAHAFGRRKIDGGTPAYMAPEQWRGAPEDERTDVFALGVILHRMLSGELPFGEDPRRARSGSRPAPALRVPQCPALGEAVLAMLEKDPVRRPRDAGEALRALASCEQELSRLPDAGAGAQVRRSRRPGLRLAALVLLGALLGAAVAAVVVERRRAPRGGQAPSIAVLPFTDMSPQKDQEYFSDGLAEEILNALAHVEGLHVAGRTSSFSFKGKEGDLRAIGEKLHVGTVLEGSVRKAGGRVRITAQIIDLANGYHLWSESFDRELTDIFAVQDEIARAVVAALRVRLLPDGAPSTKEHRTASPEAYAEYLLGKQHYARYSAEGFRRAADAYQKAVALDPGYAPARAGLAVALDASADLPEPRADLARLRERALEAAEKAVALDPDLAEAYTARGYLRAMYAWDWAGAEADLDRALALGPGDATVQRRYGIVRAIVGTPAEAIAATRRAIDIDPLYPSNWDFLADCLMAQGNLPEARSALERVRLIAPDYTGIGSALAMLSLLEGHPEEALRAFQEAPLEIERLAGTAVAQHTLGRRRESREALDRLAARYGDSQPYYVAAVQAWRGEIDDAFAWLERAFQRRDSHMVSLRHDLVMKGRLGSDPRYQALLARMNLPPTAHP
jgi:serine/threonine-protein kinase